MKPLQATDSARLFLALCPPAPVKTKLAAHAASWRWNTAAVRYTPADWHITLHFLGAVPRQRLRELYVGLAVEQQAFTLRLGQSELWPQGLAVLVPETVPVVLQPLLHLHASLDLALQRLGLKTEARPYRPHLTLARKAQSAQPPSPSHRFDWLVQSYALMESTGCTDQRYRVLKQFGPVA